MARLRSTYAERRAALAAETRARILGAARELIPTVQHDLSVDAIARRAGVAVQSIYDHFGSKGGLLVAVIGEMQRSAGLSRGLDEVFRSPDGETALRRMIATTVSLWDGAWPFLGFAIRASRTDPVVGREFSALETLRHAHYWAICRRLEDEHRIRGGHAAAWATDQAFALSAATVYEEYVVRHGWSLAAATESIVLAAMSVVLEPGTSPVLAPPPDWPALEAAAAARAIEQGADASRFPAAWRSRQGDPAT